MVVRVEDMVVLVRRFSESRFSELRSRGEGSGRDTTDPILALNVALQMPIVEYAQPRVGCDW